jgi:hypothetical protein
MEIIDKQTEFKENADGLLIKHYQDIPDWWLDELAEIRNASAYKPMGDMCPVAVVPVETVEAWMREGFNIYSPEVTAEDVVARLKAEDFSKFLLTLKSV